jgi:hypothetical protein
LFAKSIGQPIPDTWRSGVHFHNVEVNTFSPGEVVVVSRSNGTKNFGIVEKCNPAVGCLMETGAMSDGNWCHVTHYENAAKLCARTQDDTVDVKVSEGDNQNGPQYHRGSAPKVRSSPATLNRMLLAHHFRPHLSRISSPYRKGGVLAC